MGKPLINVNIPKVGRIKTRDVLYVGVIGAGIIAVWNWSSRIPKVGWYASYAKSKILYALGVPFPPPAGQA